MVYPWESLRQEEKMKFRENFSSRGISIKEAHPVSWRKSIFIDFSAGIQYENPVEIFAGQRRKADFERLLQKTKRYDLRLTVKSILGRTCQ